jgi:hypothetical protein
MATANPQGIMALPAESASAQPQLGLDDSYDAVQQGLQNASPDAYAAVNAELGKLAPALDQLPDETLDQLLQIVQYMHDNPNEYAQCLKELIDAGIVAEGDFPEEYDPEFLATMGMVIMQARKTRQGAQGAAPVTPAPMPPAGMARGGIAEAAHLVASKGRGQDTMLAHITPKEAKMLRAKGGMGTINPATGLPEYGFFSGIVKAVKGVGNAVSGAVKSIGSAVKNIVSSPIGRVLGTVALAAFIGPGAFGLTGAAGAAAQMGLASGAITALGGGNIKDVLKSAAIGGATAFFGAPGGAVSNFVGGAVTNAAANAAITSGIVGTGIGLLTGQKLQDAVKSGLTAGAVSGLATGATKGFSAQIEAPKVPTVSELATSPEGATSSPVQGQPNVQGTDLPPAEGGNYMQPAGQTTTLQPGQEMLTNPDGSLRVEVTGGRPSYLIQNQDGSITYKPVPFADRVVSDAGTISARPSVAPPSTGDYVNQPGRFGTDFGVQNSAGAPSAMNVASESFTPSATQPPTSDVLGDFIAQNDAARELANTPAVTPEPTMFQKAEGLYNRYLSPSGIQEAAIPEAEAAGKAAFERARAAGLSPGLQDAAYTKAYEAAMPGMVSTYGPMTAAGLGIAGLAGAFTPTPPQPSPEQEAMNARLEAERGRVAANPGAYVPQGLGRFGIQYDASGQITGGNAWTPEAAGPTEVAGNYLSYSPTAYSGYNFMPRYAADGGIMSNALPPSPVMRDMGGIASLAKGGYPRRTGQISGPGTETSDSIPAMLSDGEFVMTAKAVRGAGKGNRLAGAKKMYALMHQLERNAARG